MFWDLIKNVFNFSMSNDEVEDELVYLYGLELKKESNGIFPCGVDIPASNGYDRFMVFCVH